MKIFILDLAVLDQIIQNDQKISLLKEREQHDGGFDLLNLRFSRIHMQDVHLSGVFVLMRFGDLFAETMDGLFYGETVIAIEYRQSEIGRFCHLIASHSTA